VVLEFDFADGLKTSDSQELRMFEVAGADGVFVHADAVIADDKVILSSDVKTPESVRYAWQPYTSANLVNGEDLPASTFFTTISKN
jgi:sialate O-acetylesterase